MTALLRIYAGSLSVEKYRNIRWCTRTNVPTSSTKKIVRTAAAMRAVATITETFRMPPLMPGKTIRIQYDGEWRRRRDLHLRRCVRVQQLSRT